MDIQTLFNFTVGTLTTALGWFARELWSAVNSLKNELASVREDLPKNYIRKEDFRDFKEELMTVLHRIETKIDLKQDK